MSPLTRYLSRLLGVFLLIMVVSEWTQPGLLTFAAPAMVDQPALLWVSGMLTFAAGLAIVLGHNVWGDPAAAVVSLFGWLMTIKGAALLLVPATGWSAMLGAMHYPSHSGVYTIIPAVAGSVPDLRRVCPAAVRARPTMAESCAARGILIGIPAQAKPRNTR